MRKIRYSYWNVTSSVENSLSCILYAAASGEPLNTWQFAVGTLHRWDQLCVQKDPTSSRLNLKTSGRSFAGQLQPGSHHVWSVTKYVTHMWLLLKPLDKGVGVEVEKFETDVFIEKIRRTTFIRFIGKWWSGSHNSWYFQKWEIQNDSENIFKNRHAL